MRKSIYYTSLFNGKVNCIIIMILCGTNAFSQGSWDVKYVSLDALNTSFIGKEIRIDFKASGSDTLHGEVSSLRIRKLLSKSDTVNLNINNKPVQFIERWKFYVDDGTLKDQVLESVDKDEKKKIRIKEMFLESINDDSLVLQAMVCGPNSKSEEKQRIVISKSLVKGLLVSISD
jgi:hypothetical protein